MHTRISSRLDLPCLTTSFALILAAIVACLAPASQAQAGEGECEPGWIVEELPTGPYSYAAPRYAGPYGGVATAWDPDGDGPEPEHLTVAFGYKTIDADGRRASLQIWNGRHWYTPGPEQPFVSVTAAGVYNGDLVVASGGVWRWDGMTWTRLGSPFSGTTNRLLEVDGELWAVGNIRLDGQSLFYAIVRWNGESWQVHEPALSGTATDLVKFHGDLHVCGSFTVNGLSFKGILRFDDSGWQEVVSSIGLSQMTVYHDQLVAVRSPQAFFFWDGSQWSTHTLRSVQAAAVYNDKLYFSLESQRRVPSLASWNGEQVQYESIANIGPRQPKSLVVYRNQLVLAGAMMSTNPLGPAQTTTENVVSWDGFSWHIFHDRYAGLFTSQSVVASVVHDGKLVLSAAFPSSQHTVESGSVCSWNSANWDLLGHATNQVNALASTSIGLVAGGSIATPSGPEAVAFWQGNEWRALGFGDVANIHAITEYDGQIIAAGDFSSVGEGDAQVPCNSVARHDGTQWRPMGTAIHGRVRALAVYNGDLYAGLDRRSNSDMPLNDGIVRWDGAEWVPVEGISGMAKKLLVHDGELIVLGGIAVQDNLDIKYIVKWNGSAWSSVGDTSWLSVSSIIEDVEVHQGELVISGNFHGPVSDGLAVGLARFDGVNWKTMGVSNDRLFTRLASDGEVLHLIGPGIDPNNPQIANMARWDCVVPPCIGDFNGVNGVSVQDLFDFLAAWLGGNASADINHVNGVSVQDLFDFLVAWLAGC